MAAGLVSHYHILCQAYSSTIPFYSAKAAGESSGHEEVRSFALRMNGLFGRSSYSTSIRHPEERERTETYILK